jgi:hypothetical protein
MLRFVALLMQSLLVNAGWGSASMHLALAIFRLSPHWSGLKFEGADVMASGGVGWASLLCYKLAWINFVAKFA